jgi:peptide/nickel transport system substrate-binding protein
MTTRTVLAAAVAVLTLGMALAGLAATPAGPALSPGRHGGTLVALTREDLTQGFLIHESVTLSTIWPAQPCFNNLVSFDPAKPLEGMDTVIADLAEKWSWQDNYRNLVFFLRKNVKWHDGQPFTARDVKFTFDIAREAPDAPAKLRINPRKEWYENIDAIETPDPATVVFRLKRPQTSLLLMLASGDAPVLPAHVPIAEQRQRCVGTGPFKFKEWKPGEYVDLVRNPDYFVKGRPYLDGIRYLVVTERTTRTAALLAGRADAASPGDGAPQIVEQLRAGVPGMVITRVGVNWVDNLMLNHTKPPFNDVRVRRALSVGLDRQAFIKAVLQGGGVPGVSLAPPPIGAWGLTGKDVPLGNDKTTARKLLAEAGYTAANPLKVEVITRNLAIYRDNAAFVVDELRRLGVEGTLKIVESAQWYGMSTKREYQMGSGLSGYGLDDPDSILTESFLCRSTRNYQGYCDDEVDRLIAQQSQELDPRKRQALLARLQRKLEDDAARPVLAWRYDYYAHWPHVKNLIPHHTPYSYGRMQEVWLDR